MKNTRENDLRILTALYDGNHLTESELERLYKLVKLLEISLKQGNRVLYDKIESEG